MKTKKALITTLTALTLASPVLGATTANAAKWHSGVPSFLKKHMIWISELRKNDDKAFKYVKNGVYFQKDNSFWAGSYFYNDAKQYKRPGSGYLTLYGAKYKKLSKNVYYFKGTNNQSDASHYKIKKLSNTKIYVKAQSNVYQNNKWVTLGTLRPSAEPKMNTK